MRFMLMLLALAACENRVSGGGDIARAPGREAVPTEDELTKMDDAFTATAAPDAPVANVAELVSISAAQRAAVKDEAYARRSAEDVLERGERQLQHNRLILSVTADTDRPEFRRSGTSSTLQSHASH